MHHTSRIVKGSDATIGSRGERLLAHGDHVVLRVWDHEPAGEQAPEHANGYEYVAYVTAGALRVRIGEDEPGEVRAGDSFVVPADTPYAFEVLETATVVEAVSPRSALPEG
jgi:quercetin dioxygenase-like cupin family protein